MTEHSTPEAIFSSQDIIEVDSAMLEELKRRAASSPRGRFRLCMHASTEHRLQEMIIVCQRGAYFRPHRHPEGKSESYHMIEGEMDVFFFDDSGKVTRRIRMGAPDQGRTLLYRLSSSIWHLPVPVSDTVVYHESYVGPFQKELDVEYAPWSPDENDQAGVDEFLKQIGCG